GGGAAGSRRGGGEHGQDGAEGRGRIRVLAVARRQCAGGGRGQTGGRWVELADDRQPRREGVAGRERVDLLHGQFPLPVHVRRHGYSRAGEQPAAARRGGGNRDRRDANAAQFRRQGRLYAGTGAINHGIGR